MLCLTREKGVKKREGEKRREEKRRGEGRGEEKEMYKKARFELNGDPLYLK